jgi:RNA-directed DNA polymerase
MPTVADRSAPTVVKRSLEPAVAKVVHPEAEGDRPGKSALDAVGQARARGWRDDGVRDLDSPGGCDHIAQARLLRAGRQPTEGPWGRLDIARWLKAPVQRPDGTLVNREQGTPPGGVVSPRLANLFWASTCDGWMPRHPPAIPGER